MTREELEKLIEIYGRSIYGFCFHLTGEREGAEELYQDTMLKALEIGAREKGGPDPAQTMLQRRNYCIGIAIRLHRNRCRKSMRRRTLSLDDEEKGIAETLSHEKTPELVTQERETHKEVRQAVKKLPLRLRTVVYLFYYADLSVAEIGKLMHVPEGTVKSRLNRARNYLRKELGGIKDEG